MTETEAPYRRIAAEIRDRIARGELRPGDRVPSTREIVRDWGVAMATATKVIATLREDGVVDTRPGAGTVVRRPAADPPSATRTPAGRRHPSRGPELTRDRVLRAAIAVADAEGLAMLTMRRVAADLGVATMSLYRHVSGKDELVLLMTDRVFGEEPLPDLRPPHWRDRLELAGRSMWRAFVRHPWAAQVLSMTRPQVMPNLLEYAEWSLGTLRGLGLGVDDMMHTHLALFGHVRGTALSLEPEMRARQDTGMTNDEWIETQDSAVTGVLGSGRFPTFEWIIRQRFDYDLDAVFEYGLQRLLDGIEVRLGPLGR